ncbi:MAG: peptide ABC transporter substrate-binding protein [Treponema sp.]|nr:peptide ABC transporter substrate-binding protein [Treponema sp.]
MVSNSKIKFFVSVLIGLSVLLCLNAQNAQIPQNDDDLEWLEDSPVNLIYPEEAAGSKSSFVMVEPVYQHELNPQVTSYASDAQLLSGLYEGLFSYNPVNLEPQYAIATSYRISRDKLRWTFTIRDEAYFSNGEKITAQNVRDSWIQLLSTPNAPYASLLDVIKGAADYRAGNIAATDVGIYATSASTLTIHLVKPANYLPKVLCHSAFSVIHRSPTVYSGPFFLDDFDESGYVLKKNPYYWDNENVQLNEIVIIQSDDEDENAYYYNTGLANWVTSSINTDKLINKNETYQFNAEFATSFFFFRIKENSIWSVPAFRNALFEAFPWEDFRSKYYVQAQTLVYPLTGYPEVEGFSYTDISEAKNLMKQAREDFGISQNKIIPVTLEISENSFKDEQINLIAQAWAPLGVDLKVRRLPSGRYFSHIPVSDADIFNYVWIGDFADPLAFLELFRGDSSLNDSHWKNEEFDALLEEAAQADAEERYKILSRAETLLLDNYMVIPIQHPVTYNIINLNEVGGWTSNAFDIHPFKYFYKKDIKSTVTDIVKK